MPRKKLIYTSDFPYHVVARSNNKEWFDDLNVVWAIFDQEIQEIQKNWGACIHAFVLMANHYHLVISASGSFNLGQIMNTLQTRVSKRINFHRKSINHVFGGQYRASLIVASTDFLRVLRYVYQNPVKASIVPRVEQYKFSTIDSISKLPNAVRGFPVTFLNTPVFDEANRNLKEQTLLKFLNEKEPDLIYEQFRKAIARTELKIAPVRSSRRNACAKPKVG
jgi:putative transposase